MESTTLKLANAPIIEAILDIDCAFAQGFDLAAREEQIRAATKGSYPVFQPQHFHGVRVEAIGEKSPTVTKSQGLQGFRALQADQKQLIQYRLEGFSFNRLAPYSSFDDYLPEIEHCWKEFVQIVEPSQVKEIRLRFINRLPLPLEGDKVELDDYFVFGPKLADDGRFSFLSFVQQYRTIEIGTDNELNIVLASQPTEAGNLPVIFDIQVHNRSIIDPSAWQSISSIILSLRELKNSVFQKTLTEKCIALFQHQ